MNNEVSKRNWETFFLYVFGFVLLWEWIRPLKELTNTGSIGVFVFYILLSFALVYFQVRVWIGFLVKVFIILSSIYYFYFEGGFFSIHWMMIVLKDTVQNMVYVWSGQWGELTNVFRTLLFFLLLWLMTYLVHYWLINRKRIFLFFLITLIYITVLDTFTPYSAKGAIIRAIITGFAAMGILTLNRILTNENIGRNYSFSRKWMVSLTILIICSVGIGFTVPKAGPIWPDPVPYIKSLNNKDESVNRIGYGVDDSNLGGPFIGDDRVVFQAEVAARHYWRVESKEVYTGKGWVDYSDQERISIPPEGEFPIYAFEPDVSYKDEEATITTYMEYPHAIYPFGVKHIETPSNSAFEMNAVKEKIYFKDSQVNNYSFKYRVPKYSVAKLQQVKSIEQSRLGSDFASRYTQVPNNLPPEIRELAMQITEGKETWFDKVRAVEKYFDRNEYSYDQKNVAIPGSGDDYVAQFLFDTKRGYCDNFSTSMAVMLRTLGIPTRWVKGYTDGEYKRLGEHSRKIFEVTNNNAHSWVEVFFPGSGWLAFEPTPGFTNNVTLNFDTYKEDPKKEETPLPEKKEEPKKPDREKEETNKKSNSTFSLDKLWLNIKLFFKKEWKWIVFGGIAVAFVLLYVYRSRSKWMPYFLIWKFKYRKNDESLVTAYLALLKQLERYGLRRNENQTLRDYAKYIDRFFSSNQMSRLTIAYEQYLYKGSMKNGTWLESKELWENLIKKTSA
ncbi:DUF4129 domain-containing transglutaminase family protein [Bacillus sp. CGMCC 1.16607]|uniref:DUF4129 domain-containing transglutaminase family protein n=1 Tax=Bacillus sp. CGMCC 1.16607 TaxID=3351842 RepID=UPI00362A6CB9